MNLQKISGFITQTALYRYALARRHWLFLGLAALVLIGVGYGYLRLRPPPPVGPADTFALEWRRGQQQFADAEAALQLTVLRAAIEEQRIGPEHLALLERLGDRLEPQLEQPLTLLAVQLGSEDGSAEDTLDELIAQLRAPDSEAETQP